MQSYVAKADSESKGAASDPLTKSRLSCASGLAELAARKYPSAARRFLSVSFESFHYPELVSAGNVAIYGGLTALATLNRKELKESVLQSSNFKQFLELEPAMRETILGTCIFKAPISCKICWSVVKVLKLFDEKLIK